MCICGNELSFDVCCRPIIEKKREAQSAEELMRSRYCAYVRANAEYLLYSTVKENRYEDDAPLIEDFSKSVEWLKLDVLNAADDVVEFKAYYQDAKGIKVLHEKSNFTKEDGIWKYKDGELYNSKVERNESCPCGSGKKYKKCCAR
ncbi:YchJ family metal-binding protein [Sulfurimonas sp.]|uniref:YchJ family protein n=1 Tax=Sulfurimonas sp. TaxID=2022749 RepID=UPI00260A2B6C|nr:YchJ family metal-binding protein [Sulfurimonas sp.]